LIPPLDVAAAEASRADAVGADKARRDGIDAADEPPVAIEDGRRVTFVAPLGPAGSSASLAVAAGAKTTPPIPRLLVLSILRGGNFPGSSAA
jgi:hypothetical protein